MSVTADRLGRARLVASMPKRPSTPGGRRVEFLADHLEGFAYFFLCTVVTALWYRHAPLVWGDDATFPFTSARATQYFHLLDPGLGGPDGRKFPFLFPIGLLFGAWRAVHLPYSLSAIQPVLIVGLLFASAMSMHTLLRRILPSISRTARFGGGLLYAFNLYAMTTVWSAMSLLVIEYAFLPLVVLAWIAALRRASITWALGAALVWLLVLTPAYVTTPVAATDSALFGGVALMMAVANRGYRLRTVGAGVVLYCAWLAGSLFWLLPLLESTSAVSATGLAAGDPVHLFGLNSVRLVDALRLGGYWGVTSSFAGAPYFAWKAYYTDVALWSAIAIPVLVALGVAFTTTRRLATGARLQHEERIAVAFLVVVELVALFLITGTHAPLGGLKASVVRDLDLEGPFRSVYQRFGGYLALACAPLASLGLDVLARGRRRSGRGVAAGQALAWSAIALAVVVPCWPMFTGSMLDASGNNPARRIDPPKSYSQVASLINATPGDFDVLSLPLGGNVGVTGLVWNGSNAAADAMRGPILGYHGIEPLELMLAKGVIVNDATAPYLFDWAQSIVDADRNMTNALRLLNLGYIVLHLDEDLPFLEGSGAWTGTGIRAVARQLDKRHDLSLVYTSSSLRVYRVLDWQPFRVFSVPRGSTDPLLEAHDLQPLPYDLSDQGKLTVDTAPAEDRTVVVDRPFDNRWTAGGAQPFSLAGLTAFDVSKPTTVISFSPAGRVRLGLLLLPLTVGGLVLAVVALSLRARLRGERP